MLNYETLEILIGQKHDQGYPITVIQSPSGDANAITPLDPDNPELQEALTTLATDNIDHAFLTNLGSYLFDAIFRADILICYRESLGAVNAQDKALRLLLRLEPPELATIPWEYLYDSKERMFLAIDQETALVRYMPMGIPPRPTKCMLPLRILVVISNPVDLVQLNVEQEKRLIKEALVDRIRAGQIELRFLEDATVRYINEDIREFQPHVFHFVGHSAFQDGVTSIVLEDEKNGATLIADHTFKTFFNGSKETRLMVLNSCQGAALSDDQRFAGLVAHLFHNKLSAVVAMQYPITDEASLVFVREFYRTLAQVGSVEVAVSEARGGIYRETDGQSSEWGTPVLYLQAKTGQLIDWVTEPPEPSPPLPSAPPPNEPDIPPKASNFVGRTKELALCKRHLEEGGIALIVGMAGVGKSALAAELASRIAPPEQIFWHRFDAEIDMHTFIWKIANFLAWNDQHTLWNKLHYYPQRNQSLPPLDIMIDRLTTQLCQGNYLICLDNFQFVDGNPEIEDFIHNLQDSISDGSVKVMIMSRNIISPIRAHPHLTLVGLTEAETTKFLMQHNLSLAAELNKALYERTEGNAELLVLAANVLQKTPNPQKVIRQLTQIADIEQYLLNEVDHFLNDDERDIMSSIAVLLGRGNVDIIDAISNSNDLRRNLAYLLRRYLLTITQSESNLEYIQHAILQEFYYGLLSPSERSETHRRAADYYRDKKQDRYKALWHYHKAEEHDEAIALLDGNIWELTYHGRLHSLRTIITEMPKRKLTPEQQAIVLIAQAQIDGYLGKVETAENCYGQADLILAQESSTFDVQKRRAKISRGMAFLLRGSTPEKALKWIQRGLRTIEGRDDRLEAELLTMQGTVLRRLGEVDKGIKTLEQALAIQSTLPTRQRLLTLLALGNTYYYLGDLEKMHNHLVQAEEIGEILHDYDNLLAIRGSLMAYHQTRGHSDQLIDIYEKLLQSAEKAGSVREVITHRLNYGCHLIQRQAFGAAHEQIIAAMEDARRIQYTEAMVTGQCHLALLYLDLIDLQQTWAGQNPFSFAEEALVEAEHSMHKGDIDYHLPYLHWLKARLHLIQGAFAQADEEAKKSLNTAQQRRMQTEEGLAWRMLGQLQLEQGQATEAVLMLEKSLTCFQDTPYEKTQTEAILAQTKY